MALNGALATASRALEVFSTAVQVAGNNIANANTPGYVRDQLILSAEAPFQDGRLIIGGGVRAASIRQAIDQYLEKRLQLSNSDVEASQARQSIYEQLELELRELGDTDLSTRLNSFLAAVNEVVNQPELQPARSNVIQEGQLLASDILNLRSRLDRLREAQTTRINNLAAEANALIDRIQTLNDGIARLENNGLLSSDAGGLRTQRYEALNRLSQILPITYTERDNGVIDLYSGSDYVLLANREQHLTTTSFVDRGVRVQTVEFEKTHTEISLSGGELKGVVEARDEILGEFLDELDVLTGTLIFEFNRLHSSGEGLAGFTTVTSEYRIEDASVVLNAAGLPFAPQHGSFSLKVANQLTGIAETHRINIDLDGLGGNDTTLEDLRAALDALDNISASVTARGELQITADPNFEFRFSGDTSGILATLGINTFFTGSSSQSIGVNSAVTANQRLLATGQGGGPADNRNVRQLARILDESFSGLGDVSLSDFYDSLVSRVAQASAAESATAQGLTTFHESLLAQREQFSGVSLDEEAVRLIQAQEAFAASARVIRTVDELLQTILEI